MWSWASGSSLKWASQYLSEYLKQRKGTWTVQTLAFGSKGDVDDLRRQALFTHTLGIGEDPLAPAGSDLATLFFRKQFNAWAPYAFQFDATSGRADDKQGYTTGYLAMRKVFTDLLSDLEVKPAIYKRYRNAIDFEWDGGNIPSNPLRK